MRLELAGNNKKEAKMEYTPTKGLWQQTQDAIHSGSEEQVEAAAKAEVAELRRYAVASGEEASFDYVLHEIVGSYLLVSIAGPEGEFTYWVQEDDWLTNTEAQYTPPPIEMQIAGTVPDDWNYEANLPAVLREHFYGD